MTRRFPTLPPYTIPDQDRDLLGCGVRLEEAPRLISNRSALSKINLLLCAVRHSNPYNEQACCAAFGIARAGIGPLTFFRWQQVLIAGQTSGPRRVAVLRCVAAAHPKALGVFEIAASCGISRGSASNAVHTLVREGLLRGGNLFSLHERAAP